MENNIPVKDSHSALQSNYGALLPHVSIQLNSMLISSLYCCQKYNLVHVKIYMRDFVHLFPVHVCAWNNFFKWKAIFILYLSFHLSYSAARTTIIWMNEWALLYLFVRYACINTPVLWFSFIVYFFFKCRVESSLQLTSQFIYRPVAVVSQL